MNKVRTVSDTKRDFYNHHARPINSIYRRIIEELMVEMHLLSVNADFRSDPIYRLGVATTFDRFMQGYRPERDQESIFSALCRAVGDDPQQYRTSAENALSLAKRMSSAQELATWLGDPKPVQGEEELAESVKAIALNHNFKYSRLFATGLYTLVETAEPEVVKEEARRNEIFKQIAETLKLSEDKLKKDLEFYRSNLDKMDQLLNVLKDVLQSDRKKREQREQGGGE